MEEQINISLQDVASAANQIRLYNNNLDDTLSYILKTMNDLNNVWQSDGEQRLLERFHSFASRFIKESETIENYAKFLDNTVETYDSVESTITANASNFE